MVEPRDMAATRAEPKTRRPGRPLAAIPDSCPGLSARGLAALCATAVALTAAALLSSFGCDVAEPDPLPPRGDEEIIRKARKRLEAAHRDETGECEKESRFYRDRDGDGYGDPKESVTSCTAPEGYVENDEDCYDRNRKVHPKQRGFFHAHRGDGSFDYDCDGKQRRRIVDRAFCRLKPDEKGCNYASGWIQKRIPKCGEAGEWKWYECHEIHIPLLPEPPPSAPGAAGSDVGGAPGSEGGPPAARPVEAPPRPAPARPRPTRPASREGDDGEGEKEGPKTLETKVHYKCRGKRLPWKKMQLCR